MTNKPTNSPPTEEGFLLAGFCKHIRVCCHHFLPAGLGVDGWLTRRIISNALHDILVTFHLVTFHVTSFARLEHPVLTILGTELGTELDTELGTDI